MNRSLIRFYYAAAILAVVCMNGYNVGIDRSSLEHIFRFDFYFVSGTMLLFTIALHRYTTVRLEPVKQTLFRERRGEDAARLAFDRLTRFPGEVFRFVALAGALGSAAYHGLEVYGFRIRPFDELVLRHLAVEQAFAWTLAFVYMSVARWLLRPYFRFYRGARASTAPPRSFVRLWTGAFAAGLFFIAIPQLWFIRNMTLRGEQPTALATIGIALFAMAIASAVMFLLFFYLRRELRTLSASMRALPGAVERRPRALPSTVRDEIGELAQAIGELHAKAAKAREEQREDLALAASLQRMLLPAERCEADGLRIRCRLQSAKAVGGTFYDYMTLPDGRIALALGEVSSAGASGALMMTAAVMLLRTELRAGGSPGEVLTRLNASMHDTAGGDPLVSLGLVVLDPSDGTAKYAGAGQTAPLRWDRGSIEPVPSGGLPIGALPDTAYVEGEWTMRPGQRLILYNGGVAERFRADGQENGFAAFRDFARTLPAGGDPEESLDRIWAFGGAEAGNRDADRALLIAEAVVVPAKEERRYA
ncbi:serine/threonine-protein phosphatase [Paenibacillus antri]|uniref:Serine/threonine-protein phosphatase n=1 Tax=Paenibacillus antri TaxID=2582848 RepID=A0A5R9GFN9_9BACL|nr:PP2C family protein-serine/threonine phosphatase [Paenibacillus antri]TLS52074.1 serine/threonine-protein phosphatase [Paenibacillus antri]